MAHTSLAAELAEHGPGAKSSAPATLAAAQAYCKKLARRRYENFTVASLLLPEKLQQHFFNIYAYCRWADDLADETGDGEKSLALLDWWENELDACYRGRAEHPVFVALTETIEQFQIPRQPFADLLVAFRQDQRIQRYETFDDLLAYCRYSANPVGRLVLHLGRCCNSQTEPLADFICTGLQLANFWQDVARDHAAGRVYLPRDICRQFGYTDAMLAARIYNAEFRNLLAFEVDRAAEFLEQGRPLVELVPAELQVEVDLFVRGGCAVLAAIRRIDYNVWARRPTIGKLQKASLLFAAWRSKRRRARQGGGS